MSCSAGNREWGIGHPGRREFLRAGATAWLGLRLGGSGAAKLDRIGIQLYTVRREFAKDPEGTLARLAEIGYREVEFAGYPPGSPRELSGMLRRNSLLAPSSHVGLQAGPDWERVLDQAAAVGQKYVVVASLAPSERRTLDDWKRVAARFNEAGDTARRHGLRFCYHNHDVEFPAVDGVVPYDLLLQTTDPRLVQFEMDLYWITKAGKDPLDYFRSWPGRFPLVHVKDMDATPRRFFADLGTGAIDFVRVFRRAGQAGIQHSFYEQDETPGSPFESARVAFRYLRAMKF